MNLDNWLIENNRLMLNTVLLDFDACVELINKIATVANELDHHPNLCIRNYNVIEITIYTHNKNLLTEKDYELASRIDLLLAVEGNI